jgi:peptidoglycan hydrolase CwlO-like protein
MTKKILTIFILIFITSCQSFAQKELEKSAKANAASSRINASEGNVQKNLQELDE